MQKQLQETVQKPREVMPCLLLELLQPRPGSRIPLLRHAQGVQEGGEDLLCRQDVLNVGIAKIPLLHPKVFVPDF